MKEFLKGINKLLLFGVIASIVYSDVKAQNEFGLGAGSLRVMQRPADIDVVSTSEGFVYFQYKGVGLNKRLAVFPQLCLTSRRYIMDGAFIKDNNQKYQFINTPANYKQSALYMNSIRLPIFLKYVLVQDKEREPRIYIGIGPYAEYFFRTQQRYKVGDKNFKENIDLDKKLHAGLSAELSGYRKNKSGVSLHVGAQYQLSEYLKSSSSFKPLLVYCKLGVCL